MQGLIYTGPEGGNGPRLPEVAEKMSAREALDLTLQYEEETGEESSDIAAIASWIKTKHGDAKAEGFKWRCHFAF